MIYRKFITKFSIYVKELCICCELLRRCSKVTSFQLRGIQTFCEAISKIFDSNMIGCLIQCPFLLC